ncbi:MAG: geranylgeranylglyceryl/heptaprenylglyceryl phosphate synthase [Bacteroidales bacterium]|nr:geranylgeranylglyceryl/heptaprenylglyceryl phosphate synthase [Bacteroidales bacterium]
MSVKDILLNSEKKVAWLCDPDKTADQQLIYTAHVAQNAGADMVLIGGSHLQHNGLDHCIERIKSACSLPVVLFPGNCMQISPLADAILFLSLISGRNADLLIGQHVNVAYQLHQSNLEIIPTGYMLIDSGMPTSVSYISNTMPIPRDKTDIAVSTALAGQLLGMQAIYLEAGSGAALTVPLQCIKSVKEHTRLPLIIGGGINNGKIAKSIMLSGADMIVIGNAAEERPDCLYEIISYIKKTPFNAEENQ